MARDNKTLGKFMLDGITPAPRGIPQIEVTFKIDANGILNVSAKDKATNKSQSITITASTQLDEKEVDALVKEAAAHADDDKKAKERSESKIEADSLIFQTEKFIEEINKRISIINQTNPKYVDFSYKNKNFHFNAKWNENFVDYIIKYIGVFETFYELPILQHIEKKHHKQKTILDIGANIGNLILYSSNNANK
jgi:hypothetical protein